MRQLLRPAFGAVLAVAACCSAPTASADAYPTRPVRIIIGFGPGSAVDVTGRVVGQKVGQILGQQFVVESRPGGGSNVAAEFVARAPKDGHTLLLGNVANTVSAAISPNPSFDFARDLAPIALVTAVPTLLTAHPSLGASNVKEMIALAKAKPEQIFYGSSGVGTAAHLAGELINVMAGIKIMHVPYAGSAQALTDLLAGRIQLLLGAASTAMPHVEQGKLIALGMAQRKRAAMAPQVPTLSEEGLQDFDAPLWFGLMAPAGTPRQIVDKLAQAVNEAIRSGEVIAPLRAQGVDLIGGSPEEFTRYIATDIKKWEDVARFAGMKK
jgi:tripartite-type tricarboxylate transporter receptor subunit TctC